MKDNVVKTRIVIAAVAFLIPLVYAAVTKHVFEDYLITYKSSKNLALGNGLVYHVGERVHTFTSPLGVLIPGIFCFITGNGTDALVLWLYRIFGAVLYAFSAVLLYNLFKKHRLGAIALFLGIGLFLTDSKSIDFSINGSTFAKSPTE